MLFNSEQYVFFLPLVVLLTWALPARVRPAFLLVASYYFYASWRAPFLLLIIGMTVWNYLLGLAQVRYRSRRTAILALTVAGNLATLGVFKYIGLFDSSVDQLAVIFGLPSQLPLVQAVLPLGLSFFTFEFIHYQVDLHRGNPPIRNPIHFALFPAFFPTQIAGPIKRYEDFNTQVEQRPHFDAVHFVEGLELIAVGLFKKVVLADTLLPIAAALYAHAASATIIDAWTGLLAFTLQIYFDFSGYTDIGRGSAQLLGYRVPINFNAPYLATSIRGFWRRWHISLSSWLRDYLYIPLGGNRKGERRTQLNLMITMALGGLWHGAAWHFVLWGIGHGAAQAGETAAHRGGERPVEVRGSLVRVLRAWIVTQLIVVLLWNLFRAPGFGTALTVYERMVAGGLGHRLVSLTDVARVGLIGAGLLAAQLLLPRLRLRERLATSAWSVALRPSFVTALAVACVAQGLLNRTTHAFIYFQF